MGMVNLLIFALQGGSGKRGGGDDEGGEDRQGEGVTIRAATNGVAERLLPGNQLREDEVSQGVRNFSGRSASFLEHHALTERQVSSVTDVDNEVVAMATPQLDRQTSVAPN